MELLAQLRELGVRVTVSGRTLVAASRVPLADATRTTIRVNKGALLRQLAAEAETCEKAVIAARDAADLAGYRAALVMGRLHLCGNCRRYTFGQDPSGPGICSRFGEGLVPFLMPFECAAFESSATPIAPGFLPDQDGTGGR